jgi:hypothetical protein
VAFLAGLCSESTFVRRHWSLNMACPLARFSLIHLTAIKQIIINLMTLFVVVGGVLLAVCEIAKARIFGSFLRFASCHRSTSHLFDRFPFARSSPSKGLAQERNGYGQPRDDISFFQASGSAPGGAGLMSALVTLYARPRSQRAACAGLVLIGAP